jgi:hypothetical protein
MWKAHIRLFLTAHKDTLVVNIPYEDDDECYVLFSEEPPCIHSGKHPLVFDLKSGTTSIYIAPR